MIQILLAAVVGICIGILPVYFYRKQMLCFFDEADMVLTAMIKGEAALEIPTGFADKPESVINRFWNKLRYLYEQQKLLQKRSEKERHALQVLVSDISHQVKMPLTNMEVGLGILRKEDLAESEKNEFIQITQDAVTKLDFLLHSLVKMSRLETGIIQLQPKEANVYDMLANVLGTVVFSAEEKQIHVAVDCPDNLTAVFDEKWTQEAAFNIVDNAVKYTPENGCILISGEKWECYTKITIRDSGSGIPEALHTKVFSRFYRAPQVRDKEGIGIGLTLAREIIARQNGYIKLENGSDGGAVFSIFLPV